MNSPNISIISILAKPTRIPASCSKPETFFVLSLLRTSNMTTYRRVPPAMPLVNINLSKPTNFPNNT